jgi:lipid-A-disaccharide synthase-like uncharacterized protein
MKLWLLVGFLGQVLFFSRFLVQWIASERRKQSVVPEAFWYLSLGGAALLLAYALQRRDPVFVVGQLFGFSVYVRNLVLIRRRRQPPEGTLRTALLAAFVIGSAGRAGAQMGDEFACAAATIGPLQPRYGAAAEAAASIRGGTGWGPGPSVRERTAAATACPASVQCPSTA